MLLAIIVLVNGAFVPSLPPARLLFGHFVAPLAPVIARIADQISVTGNDVAVVRAGHTCVFRAGTLAYRCDARIRLAGVAPFARGGVVFLPLAEVVRGLGGSLEYDAPTGTVQIAVPTTGPVATPSPFDPGVPQVVPTQIFTPQPGPATPQVPQPGDPRPRRTAVPATPSRVPD